MKPYFERDGARLFLGDCRESMASLPAESVQCCVTSPPYFGLRDYGVAGQIGLEPTPEEYVEQLVSVFRDVRRVLRADGTLWLNLGDSYAAQGGAHGGRADNQSGVGARRTHEAGGGDKAARVAPDGLKPKDLIGIPWRVAFALQADGWYLRQDIIWHKPNPMPESVRDRCTKAHEYLFLLSKNERYFFDSEALQEPAACPEGAGNMEKNRYIAAAATDPRMRTKAGLAEIGARATRNKRSVWTVAPSGFKGAHFATFPPALVEPCILAGSRPGDVVLDPFNGAGTTGLVAVHHGRRYVGCDVSRDYLEISRRRLERETAQMQLFGRGVA